MALSAASVSWSLLASATLAVLLLLAAAPAHSRSLLETDKVSTQDLCTTASFRELCLSMLKNGHFKDEFEMAGTMLQQASQKIQEALAEVDRVGGSSGKQAKYIKNCKKDYQSAGKAIQAAINAFSHPIDDFENWNRYLNDTLEAARTTYNCVAYWEDSRPTEKFLLDEVSTNLYQLMFNTYDLSAKIQVHTS